LTFFTKRYRYQTVKIDIKILLTADQRYAKFVWVNQHIKDAKDVDAVELYALKGNRDNVAAEWWCCNRCK
jgi:hypothetical protein